MRDSVETELQPCPFCGGEAEADYAWHDRNYPGVHCNNCGAYVFDYDSEEKLLRNGIDGLMRNKEILCEKDYKIL